jgi:lysine-N-methylase
MLRRHLVDGEEKLILHDTRVEEIVELDAEQLQQIRVCDGTRDIGGVLLAAARAGVYTRASKIESLLAALAQRGLLADGIAPRHAALDGAGQAEPTPSFRPLERLDGYQFRCDGNGSCCTTYASIPFGVDDARRASRRAPDVMERDEAHFFLPLYGSSDADMRAVTMVDGACAFLDADGMCRVHDVKPRGCDTFPACFVDDGDAVRASVALECPCVLSSLSAPAGESLAEDAGAASEVPPGARVVALPEHIRLHADATAPRAALRRWSVVVLDAIDELGPLDGVAVYWALADEVAAHGLDTAPLRSGLNKWAPPRSAALGLWLLALAAKTADKRETTAAWRGKRDRSRRLSAWLDQAAQALLEPKLLEDRLSGPGPNAAHEAFHLRSTVWGHQLVSRQLTLEQSLRDRAIRLLLARQCAEAVPEESVGDPSARYPLTAVEAMMRGQGLDAYAAGLT